MLFFLENTKRKGANRMTDKNTFEEHLSNILGERWFRKGIIGAVVSVIFFVVLFLLILLYRNTEIGEIAGQIYCSVSYPAECLFLSWLT